MTEPTQRRRDVMARMIVVLGLVAGSGLTAYAVANAATAAVTAGVARSSSTTPIVWATTQNCRKTPNM